VLIGLYALCNAIAVTHIEAISLKNNPSKKIGHRFVADNDTFWAEISSDRNADGDFVLPLVLPERAIEQVPSKRKKLWQARKMLKDDVMKQSRMRISRMLNPETIRNKTCYGAGPTAGAKLDYENFGTNSDC
jgi:uncharacterized protein VirK/YbjX